MKHVDVLNLEGASGGLHTYQHPAIDWKTPHASVGTAVSASKNDPLTLGHRVQNRQSRVGENGFNLFQRCLLSGTSILAPHSAHDTSVVLLVSCGFFTAYQPDFGRTASMVQLVVHQNPRAVADLVACRARRTPIVVAVRDGDGTLTL